MTGAPTLGRWLWTQLWRGALLGIVLYLLSLAVQLWL